MNKQPPVALVCAGPVSRTEMASLPGICEQVRWVKAGQIASATRTVRTLGCGQAVRTYSELAEAKFVLIKASDAAIPKLVAEMALEEFDWADRTVILFNTNRDSIALTPLEKLGALPASATRLAAMPDIVLVEGHPEALRRLRSALKGRLPQVMELRRGGKTDYLTGVRLGTSSFLPTIASTIDHFRQAGMDKAVAEKTAASLFEATIRAYFRAGKRLLRHAPKPRA